jgi:hypothetical protein
MSTSEPLSEHEALAIANELKPRWTLWVFLRCLIDPVILTIFAVSCFGGYLLGFLLCLVWLHWWSTFQLSSGIDMLRHAMNCLALDITRNLDQIHAKIESSQRA